jgi:hypothetical protein
MKKKTGARQRRDQLRKVHFNYEDVWLGGKEETGWVFCPKNFAI